MRVLGIDVGRRRIGLAISDATGTLARPLETLLVPPASAAGQGRDAVDLVAAAIARLDGEDNAREYRIGTIVVGMPVRLDGSPNDETARVATFIESLRRRTTIPIVLADERLTSREAESRLALREKDWRKRKARLDAAAAAIILQDYLDRLS